MDNKRMNQNTLVARILVALLFIVAGIGKVLGFAGTSGYIASKGLPMPDVVAVLTIAVELGGGLALALGYRVKCVSWLLIAFTAAASLIFHNFWSMEGQAVMMNQTQFLKNLAIIGGLLLFATYGGGTCVIACGKGDCCKKKEGA